MTAARARESSLVNSARMVLLACVLSAGRVAGGQPTQPAATQPEPPTSIPTLEAVASPLDLASDVTAEELIARAAQAEVDTQLTVSARAEVGALYRQAAEQAHRAAGLSARFAQYRQTIEATPALLEELRARMARAATQPATSPTAELPADATPEFLKQKLAMVQAELTAARDALAMLDKEDREREERRIAIPGQVAAIGKLLDRINTELAARDAQDGAPARLAQRALLRAQRAAAEQEIQTLQEELRLYDARRDLLAVRRRLAQADLAAAQERVAAWETAVTAARQAEAQRQKMAAEAELARSPRAVRELAVDNARLAEERQDAITGLGSVAERRNGVAAQFTQRDRELAELRTMLNRFGMSDFVGPRLLRLRARVPLADYRADLERSQAEYAQVQARLSALEAELVDLDDLDAAATERIQALRVEQDAALTPGQIARLRELLASRSELVSQLRGDYVEYAQQLESLGQEQRALLEKATELGSVIEERILWVRSTEPLWEAKFPSHWERPGRALYGATLALGRDVMKQPVLYAFIGLSLLLLLELRRRAARRLPQLAEQTAKMWTDSFGLTLWALIHTLVMVVPVPLLLVLLSQRISAAVEVDEGRVRAVGEALGGALWSAAYLYVTLAILWHLCRPRGLAEAHFRWDELTVAAVRRHVPWMAAMTISVTIVVATLARVSESLRDSYGRLGFILALCVVALFLALLLRPGRGVATRWVAGFGNGWIARLRYPLYVAIVLLPLALAALSLLGYHYTAIELTRRAMSQTVWLILALVLLRALLLRWLFVAQRRLAAEKARKKRAALAEAAAKSTGGADAPDLPAATLEEESGPDIWKVSDQARRLLRMAILFCLALGLWAIWVDILPALRFIGNMPLWASETAPIAAGDLVPTLSVPAADNAPAAGTPAAPTATAAPAAILQYITVADLGLALVLALVTLLLARNIPGLLEITLLQRLPLDAGGRFAVTAVARYIIVVAGVIATFGAVGIGWSKVQWLVAAVTVGLGFGLQEIFANFVSGLVLLFERPIRIGDVVTVDNITGTVTRIRIRATTILDWDRKDLVVPNKQFITGQVVNWTLSDAMQRLIIRVGVAYGSDTDRVEQLMLKIARETPDVLPEPAPAVFFQSFGDSTLNYEMFVFVARLDRLVATRHTLNKAIEREFRAAGIEIAFPQHDIHIRTIGEVLQLQQQDGAAAAAAASAPAAER